MAIEPASWVIPAAKEVYDHREEIVSAWDRIVSTIVGKKRTVVFTGMGGAGKTVLFDHLSGAAFSPHYKPPSEASQAVEVGKLPGRKKRIRVSVVPGQESQPRLQSLKELFYGDKPINGIVHVVSNGFVEIREAGSREVLINDVGLNTMQRFRDHQLREEVEDLDATCDAIRQSAQTHHMPNWMIVAVNKCDLYVDQIEQARLYYSAPKDSPFFTRLVELEKQLGSDNFRWTVMPVCSWLEDFEWNGNTRKSRLNVKQRNALLSRFATTLESYCTA